MALEFVRDTDTTTVSKTDKYKPVQYIEPKKVIKAGAEGQPPTLGMATRAPLQFAPSGEKITPTAKGWLNENVARPAAGTVLGLDPLSQMTGGQYNIGGAVDPLAHFLSYYKSQLTGAPVQGPQAVSQGERALQAETPPWVQAGMEAYMGGHPYGLGHQFQGAQPMPRMAPEPPSRFKNATPEVVKAATTAEMDRLERTAPPPAQRQATPEQRQRLETIMTRQAESQALGRGAGREVTNPAREAQRLADTAARERNRAMREARKGGTYTRTKEAAAQEARTLLGPSPGTFEERAASAVADTLPPEQGMRVAAKLPKQERMGPELTVGRQPREARHHREFQSLFTERYPTAARGMPGAPEAAARKPGKIITRGSIGPKQPKPPAPLTKGPARSSGMQPVAGPRGGKVGLRDPARALRGARVPSSNPLKETWHSVQAYLSPSTASEGARGAHQIVRSSLGENRRTFIQEATRLDAYRKEINALDPVAKRAVRDYIQGYQDVVPALNMLKASWLPFVKALKDANEGIAKKFQKLSAFEKKEFEENYLSQYWQESMRDRKRMSARGHFMEKKYETYRHGEAAGLHPKFDDPIEIQFQYMKDVYNFLAKEDSLEEMLRLDYAKKLGKFEREPIGTTLLKHVGRRRIYAADDVARVWENSWGPGIHEHTDMGKLYMGVVQALNASTGFVLGLSGYHALNIVHGAIEMGVQGAIKAASEGKPWTAAKKLAVAPAAPYALFRKGSALHDVFTARTIPTIPGIGNIADLLAQSNMTVAEFEPIYRASGQVNWVEAYKRGVLGKELKEGIKGAIGVDPNRNPLGSTYSLVARTLDSTMHPLFAYFIPRVKAGAFFEKMNSFIESNPGAIREEQVREAQRIADSIENVEGLLTQQNVMVAPLLKQTANLLMMAPGWTFGALRAYGQGAIDIAQYTHKAATGKYEPLTQNAAYVLSAAVTMGALSAVAQMYMCGEPPSSPLDLIAPRTGGKNPDGSPERLLMPGNFKDLLGYYHDPVGELANKVRPPWKAAKEVVIENKDWANHPIRNTNDPLSKQIGQAASHIIKTIGEPIAIQQIGSATQGSAIPSGARWMGVRPVGGWLANAERTGRLEKRAATKEWQKKLRFERRQENRKAPVTKPLAFARPGSAQTPRQPLRFEYRQ